MHRLLMGAALAVAVIFGATASAGERPTPPDPQRVIVKFKGSMPGRAVVAEGVLTSVSSAHGVRFEKYLTLGTGAVSYWIRSARDEKHLDRVIAALARSPRVAYAERSRYWRALSAPVNDPRYGEQWHYFEPAGGIKLPQAWTHSTGLGVVVAVVDTGIVPHADLDANVIGGHDMISDPALSLDPEGRDSDPTDMGDWITLLPDGQDPPPDDRWNQSVYDSTWHGTHVAGTIAAVTNNGLGVAGVAYNAGLLPIRVIGKEGQGAPEDIADGILWAAGAPVASDPPNGPLDLFNSRPASVINVSLGIKSSCPPSFADAVAEARNRGASVVVAAGKANVTPDANAMTPANCPGVITVAALDRQGGPASFTSLGTVVDLGAPGGTSNLGDPAGPDDVLSTMNTGTQGPVPGGDTYGYKYGSSMAAPHVAGVLALIRSINPTFTVAQAEQRLLDTARDIDCPGCGNKALDAAAAVIGAKAPTVTLAVSGGSMAETGGSVTVTTTLSRTFPREIKVPLTFSGSALEADYSASAAFVTFQPGETSRSITLTASDDGAQEANEDIIVSIAENTTEVNYYAHAVAPKQVTVTITDDDTPAVLSFASASYEKLENLLGEYLTVTVNRSGGLAKEVTVGFSRYGGSATPNSDFYSSSTIGTLRWLANEGGPKTFRVRFINDSTPEIDETLQLILSNPTGGAIVGSPNVSTITIYCNDGGCP